MENLNSMVKLLSAMAKRNPTEKQNYIRELTRENLKLSSELNHLKVKIEGLLNRLEKGEKWKKH